MSYVAIKGLTLIPQFCPDASLRHQNDFDYLVDEQSFPRAKAALESMGYLLTKQSTWECSYATPLQASSGGELGLYEATAPHAVELHLSVGDCEHLLLSEPQFFDNAVVKRFEDVPFRALPDAQAFLLQSLHAFYHILGNGWLRLSWFFEIAFFLKAREADHQLWCQLARELTEAPRLREMITVVSELTTVLFRVPVPPLIRGWKAELRSPVRVWIDNYARKWILGRKRLDEFTVFSTRKLPLFLHQQYMTGTVRAGILRQLVPLARLGRVTRTVAAKPSTALRSEFRRRERIFRRSLFHLGAGLRYLWEVPRWKWLNMKYESALALRSSESQRVVDIPGADSPILNGPRS